MTDDLDINISTSKISQDTIANKNINDSKSQESKISIFQVKDLKTQSQNIDNLKDAMKLQLEKHIQEVAVRDATYIAPSLEITLIKQEKTSEVKETSQPKPAKLGAKSNIRTNYDWSEEEFANVLDKMLNAPRYKGKFKNSVLQGKAKAFIEAGKKFNIDPRILVAISMCESQRGISEKALKLNNVGGLKIGGKYHHFVTVEASIDSIAKTINSRYKEGFTTPAQIAHSGKYCAKYAATNWLSDVNSYLNFFDKYYK